ncbi:unnamed protein product [Thelazia callipaeda]|uniref:Cyclic nucleotide-binding domain-containing protein n=1 Tax=Thelazia callipaeda TaxID=103827 RepID=A0A0N5CMC4_THECL|nr:unnamed protein product [Thelazia callipaeda]
MKNECDYFYYWWSGIVSLACLYNYFMISIMIFEDVYQHFYFQWICTNIMTDLVFLLDIIVQARKGSGFCSKTFRVDVLAVIPFDLLLFLRNDLTLLRCNRLLKIYRIWNFDELTEIHTSLPNLFHFLKLTTTCIIIFHLNSCLYHVLNITYNFNTADIDDWIFSYDKILDPIFITEKSPNLPQVLSIDMNNQDWEDNVTKTISFSNFTKQYGLSFYWSALTLFALGEQPSPTYLLQFLFETVDTIIGLVIFAMIVGDVGNMISKMNIIKANFENTLDGCKQILPSRLYGDLIKHSNIDMLKKVELFQDCERNLLSELVLMLELEAFSSGDYVCREGDVGKEMYIVRKGQLQVINEDGGKVLDTLREGSVFGELSVLNVEGVIKNENRRRTITVRSVGFSELHILTKDSLWDILDDYPESKKILLQKGYFILFH